MRREIRRALLGFLLTGLLTSLVWGVRSSIAVLREIEEASGEAGTALEEFQGADELDRAFLELAEDVVHRSAARVEMVRQLELSGQAPSAESARYWQQRSVTSTMKVAEDLGYLASWSPRQLLVTTDVKAQLTELLWSEQRVWTALSTHMQAPSERTLARFIAAGIEYATANSVLAALMIATTARAESQWRTELRAYTLALERGHRLGWNLRLSVAVTLLVGAALVVVTHYAFTGDRAAAAKT